MTILDQMMPVFEFKEFHSVTVRAPLPNAYAALKQVSLSEMASPATWLLDLRALPARLTGRDRPKFAADRPLLEAMRGTGFVLLAEAPGSEVVIGMIGQPWKLVGGDRPHIRDTESFRSFDKPGYARIVTNLMVIPGTQSGRVRCTTETRVHVPDPAARWQFSLYWRVISIGSGLLRQLWLNAIKRRAERNALQS